jgi:hypothetical protein
MRSEGMLDAVVSDPEAYLDIADWADPVHAS